MWKCAQDEDPGDNWFSTGQRIEQDILLKCRLRGLPKRRLPKRKLPKRRLHEIQHTRGHTGKIMQIIYKYKGTCRRRRDLKMSVC